MEEYDMKHTPHDTRHTCISMMADAGGCSYHSKRRLPVIPAL